MFIFKNPSIQINFPEPFACFQCFSHFYFFLKTKSAHVLYKPRGDSVLRHVSPGHRTKMFSVFSSLPRTLTPAFDPKLHCPFLKNGIFIKTLAKRWQNVVKTLSKRCQNVVRWQSSLGKVTLRSCSFPLTSDVWSKPVRQFERSRPSPRPNATCFLPRPQFQSERKRDESFIEKFDTVKPRCSAFNEDLRAFSTYWYAPITRITRLYTLNAG